jgi:hypothetical protein
MFESILLGILLVVMTTVIHYESLALASKMVERHVLGARRTIFSLVLLLPLIHILEVSLYAVGYFLMRDEFHLGSLKGDFLDTFATYLYFSLETFATIGFGDIVPDGPIRFLAGIEGLNGTLLMGWSGSFVFIVMQRYWRFAKPDSGE